jgi:abortive infection bacteriophage resistance protein
MTTLYAKPARSLPALLTKICSRGLHVTNPAELRSAMDNLGYYRIAGYAYPFLVPPARKIFKTGTTWDRIARLYEFDRELRLLVSGAIERIEIGLRARLISATTMEPVPGAATTSPGTVASTWGPHWYLDVSRFHPGFNHSRFISKLEQELGIEHDTSGVPILPSSHAEAFIAHYYTKYGSPHLPPFWMVAEILTLGSLSSLYRGLGPAHLKLQLAHPFGVTTKVMVSWLHSLAHLRNICAHHGRLWNRVFSIIPLIPPRLAETVHAANRFEGHATTLVEMLRVTAPADDWRANFRALLTRFPEIDPAAMGFGASWSTPYWQS